MNQWLAVALGGSLGAIARFAVANYWLVPVPGRLPLATVFVNVFGSFLMGFAYIVIVEQQWFDPQWRNVLLTGFLGAFTTFSTFSLEAMSLWQNQSPELALIYVAVNVLASLLCVVLGAQLAMKII